MAEVPGGGGGLLKILFWGTPVFALPALRALVYEGHDVVGVVTQPDRPKGRGQRLAASPVKEVALEEGIPLFTPEKPRGETFLEEIGSVEPELSVVVAYGHILGPEVLELPPSGSINVHASLLPALRGAAPVNWAILRGMAVTGVTVMRMVEAMDAGPIILQATEEIHPGETAAELGTRLSELGAEALVEALALMDADVAEEREQDHESATYAPKLSRETARVDWGRSARELDWHVRGLDEVPGAWSTLEGRAVKLFLSFPETGIEHGSPPGTVLEVSEEGGLLVACGQGALRLGEVHPAGGRRMRVGPWLRGHPVQPGASFE